MHVCMHVHTVYLHLYCIFPLVLYISFIYGCNMFRVSPAGVLGNLFFGLSLSDSIEHRRVHHQLEPDTVFAEGMCLTCIASAPGCWTPECMLPSPQCPCDSQLTVLCVRTSKKPVEAGLVAMSRLHTSMNTRYMLSFFLFH